MNLEEVDVVGLQAPQAAVHRLLNLCAIDERPTAHPSEAPSGRCDLGRDDHVIALAVFLQPRPDDRFGASLRLRARRYRVHLGRIDEIDSSGQCIVELLMTLGFAVLLTPCHGPQAQLGHLQLARAQLVVTQ